MKYDKAYVTKYLESMADISSFYVLTTEQIRPGLISYYVDGQLWNLMEDDNDLVDSCIIFLKENGNPVFENIKEADAYGESLKSK